MVMKYKDRKRALAMANVRREAGYEEEYWSRLRSLVVGNSRSNSPAVKKLRGELAQKLKQDIASILSSDLSEEEKATQLTAVLNQSAKSLPNQVKACQLTNAELLTHARKNLFVENAAAQLNSSESAIIPADTSTQPQAPEDSSPTASSPAKENTPEVNSNNKYELRDIFESLGVDTQKVIAIKFFQFIIGFTEEQLNTSPSRPYFINDAVLLFREILGNCEEFSIEYGRHTPDLFAELIISNRHKYTAELKKRFDVDAANPEKFAVWLACIGTFSAFKHPESSLNLILA